VWHFPYPLDEASMGRAASMLIGEHDFTSFAAVDPERGMGKSVNHEERPSASLRANSLSESDPKVSAEVSQVSNVRRLFSSTWERQEDEFVYTVRGSGFLHHMVRNLVGTFILVGKRTLQIEDVTRILEARNRSAAGATAPASGLYLVNVEY
jgi:tRNA pseudouridine38-40 synthase